MKFFQNAGIIIIIFLLLGCTKLITKQPETISTTPIKQELRPPSFTKKTKKDTLTYIVAFHDSLQRRNFSVSLENLIKNSLSPVSDDSSNAHFVKAKIVAAEPSGPSAQAMQPQLPVPRNNAETAPAPTTPPIPRTGGSITIYTPQGCLLPPLALIAEAFPFDKRSCGAAAEDSASGYFVIKEAGDRKITLELTPLARTAGGKPLSAFDMVTGWNNFVKRHPAEGRALFRYVTGVDQFISGREALIMGFQVIDERTIALRFSQPDQFALARLCTPRLCPPACNVGPYVTEAEKPDMVSLAPNPHFPGGTPFLHSCEIRLAKDNNPFVAYSLRRYTAMVLFSTKDLEYARRIAADKSDITIFSEDRYFLSLALQPEGLRRLLGRCLDKRDILTNSIKGEGMVLSAIESADTGAAAATQPSSAQSIGAVPIGSPIVVLFRSDDPVSRLIGNKLLADFSRAGISCALKAATEEEYERSLVKRDYGVAVGWASQSVLTDQSQRLRLATLWFNDETNERARIESIQEIPLFSVTSYLLHSKKLVVNKDDLKGMFLQE